VFFSTAESLRELIYTMKTTDQNRTQKDAEQWLQKCKRDPKTGSPAAYWDSIRIFRVTIEEVPRKPGTANANPPARKRRAGGKT